MKKEDVYYQAMLARDHRFDGKFFIGVKTTGIYCRPICPAKPKRHNIEFFANYLEAEKAGYRPCKRCRPEAAPSSPAWIGKSATVKRALKILNSTDVIQFNEDDFAAKFGVSARHLRRLFNDEIGRTPKQIAFENRLHLARKLMVETNLPITEVAYASGFSSIRRYNAAFKEKFRQTPTTIRKHKVKGGSSIQISLSYRPPFDFDNLLHFYKSHKVGDLEWFDDDKICRVVEIEGKVGTVTMWNQADKSMVNVEIDFPDTSKIHMILSQVRNFLDIDMDPLVVTNALERDPKIKKLIHKYPGTRLPSGWDGFEIGVSTILGQLVSIAQGRSLVADLIDLLGKDSGLEREGKKIKLFPRPKDIINGDLSSLKTTNRRKDTIVAFAKAVDGGQLSLESTQSTEDFYKKLINIHGIGPWTASYMSLKALRDTDAFPQTDLIIARALEKYSADKIEKMRPWRGYVAILLWQEYASVLSRSKTK
ncbi:MAG: DNA-3-methyladenine glycosylase 2 family protein [Bdellovibrionales bacterium]|nr:DNA-3-methyladenine glycosylase 2 family protein [Bdellovibrionales bacterium]